MSDEESTFKVKDRRRFDSDGVEREDAEVEEPRPEASEIGGGAAPTGSDLPAIDFSTFILSLGTSVMIQLGEASDPDGKAQANLPLARQTIDILGMLKDKTTGNLTQEEGKLLDQLLYDLRLRFVAAQQGA